MHHHDELAALLATGSPVRAAVERWHVDVSASGAGELERTSRRLRLGQSVHDAVAATDLDSAEALAEALAIAELAGSDAAAAVRSISKLQTRREAQRESSSAAVSGARLSIRMIAALPLLFLPLAIKTSGDVIGIITISLGIVLGVAGWKWSNRLIPAPSAEDDVVAVMCERIAAQIRSGSDPRAAVMRALSHGGRDADAVRRRLKLGMDLPGALRSVAAFEPVATALSTSQRHGSPPAASLEAVAAARRSSSETLFEERLRRAPVLMVLPLTLCTLPSFVLLALVPLLRSLRIG